MRLSRREIIQSALMLPALAVDEVSTPNWSGLAAAV
jgi:hypothetical protein